MILMYITAWALQCRATDHVKLMNSATNSVFMKTKQPNVYSYLQILRDVLGQLVSFHSLCSSGELPVRFLVPINNC